MTVVAPVIVVGCGAAKRDRPAPAADLYTGSLFRAAARAAAADGRDWLICSAAHGLVRPDLVLAPYDRTLSTEPADLDRLAALIGAQVPPPVVELWAPARYGEALARAGVRISSAPLHGLGIGQQIGWLARWARSARAWHQEHGGPPGPGVVGDWWLEEPTGLRYAGSLTDHHGIAVLQVQEGRTVQDGSLLGLTRLRVVLANGVRLDDVHPASLVQDPPPGRTPSPAAAGGPAAPTTRSTYRTAATGPARAARGKEPRCST